jgi:hypothetical protein
VSPTEAGLHSRCIGHCQIFITDYFQLPEIGGVRSGQDGTQGFGTGHRVIIIYIYGTTESVQHFAYRGEFKSAQGEGGIYLFKCFLPLWRLEDSLRRCVFLDGLYIFTVYMLSDGFNNFSIAYFYHF